MYTYIYIYIYIYTYIYIYKYIYIYIYIYLLLLYLKIISNYGVSLKNERLFLFTTPNLVTSARDVFKLCSLLITTLTYHTSEI